MMRRKKEKYYFILQQWEYVLLYFLDVETMCRQRKSW